MIAATLLALPASPARAQTAAALNGYRPAERPEGGFMLSGARTGGHLMLAAQLHVDYANDPLVYEDVSGRTQTELVGLVQDQVTAQLGLALGLSEIAMLYAALPLHLMMRGDTLGDQPTATGFGSGDLTLGARVAVHGSRTAAVALQLTATAPTAEAGSGARPGVAGDAGATIEPEVTAELAAGPLVLLANVGTRFRRDTRFAGTRFSDVLTFGAGLALPLVRDRLRLHAEAQGASPLDDIGDRAGSPLQALLGLKLTPRGGLSFGLAGGAGLLRGYGAPDARAVFAIGYSMAQHARDAEAPEPSEPAGLHVDPELEAEHPIAAGAGASVAQPGPATDAGASDQDGDGLHDPEDGCPAAPGPTSRGGCPSHYRYDPERGAFELLAPVRFSDDVPTLAASGLPLLDEVAAWLRAYPDSRLRIEAHLLPDGREPERLARSQARAAAVASWLMEARAVPAQNLEAYGCGSNRAIVAHDGPQRHKNERIELHVVHPLPEFGKRSTLGCTRADLPGAEPSPAPGAGGGSADGPEQSRTPAAAPTAPAAAAPKPVPTTAGPKPGAASAAQWLAALGRDPRGDADSDGVRNRKDQCPLAPSDSGRGCPESHSVDLEAGRIELLKPLKFAPGSDALRRRSRGYLAEIAATLRANPRMRVRIAAHVATEPGADGLLQLTRERAAAVREALAARGVPHDRIQTYGCGDRQPVAPNNVPWGRRRNERIEIHLLDPAPSSGVHSIEGCSASD